jgi:hypothetical protein
VKLVYHQDRVKTSSILIICCPEPHGLSNGFDEGGVNRGNTVYRVYTSVNIFEVFRVIGCRWARDTG